MIKKKKVASICKSSRCLKSQITSDGTQWIGDGGAMYILAGIKPMSMDSLASMLDYTEKDIASMTLSDIHAPDKLFSEDNSTDVQIEAPPRRVIIKNAEYLIFETSSKLIFIDGDYLKPIVADDQTTYFMRTVPGENHTALCVKKGFLPEAIILGVEFKAKALNDWFNDLNDIMSATAVKYIPNLENEVDFDLQVTLEESGEFESVEVTE